MVKLGLIGCGNWGANLLRNLASLESAELTWVCDADPQKLQQVRQRYPRVKCSTVFTDVLQDSRVEGVVIATPPFSHAALAKQALLAGKNVFVEKPLALSAEDAQSVVTLAEQKDRLLMVGHLLRYHPAVLKLKEIIHKGDIGEVFYIYSQRLNLGVIRRYENALWNLGCHDISVIIYLLGAYPISVSAMGKAYAQKDVEDTVFVSLHFPNNQMAHIHVSWLDPSKKRKLTVVGSKKMAVFDDMEEENKLILYDKGFIAPEENSFDAPIQVRKGNCSYPKLHRQEPLHLEVQHFAECVRQNKRPRTDGHEGFKVVEILEAAQKSMERNGAPESLRLENYQLPVEDAIFGVPL